MDAYTIGTADSGLAESPDASGPFTPKPPYLTSEACESCLHQDCPDEQAECAMDDSCSAWLSHVQSQPNHPGSMLERSVTRVPGAAVSMSDAIWASEHGEENASRSWWHLNACARETCLDACDVGRDFACTGGFEYSASFPRRITIRQRVTDVSDRNRGLAGWLVDVCTHQRVQCDSLARATTDADGFAVIDVPIPALMPSLPELDGYILFSGVADYLPVIYSSSAPIVDGAYGDLAPLPLATIEGFFKAFGEPFDLDNALFYVQPADCGGLDAKRVSVEVWIADGSGYRSCTDGCGILYQNDAGVPDRARTEISGRAQLAFVYGVPAREVAVLVRDTETAAIVGVQHVVARAGHAHLVSIYPPTAGQLAGVPREAR